MLGRWTVAETVCLVPVWDGPYRHRCGLGVNGVCAYHGPHQPHPDDGKPCEPNLHDGFCHQHGVYLRDLPATDERTPR